MTLAPGLLLLLWGLPAFASPFSFGRAELDAALADRKLQLRIKAELDDLPADSFKIEATRIRGGDARGLMYGLLEAAEQIRTTGKLKPLTYAPSMAVRSARMIATQAALQRSPDYWETLFQQLARSRFNRFYLSFEQPPDSSTVAAISRAAADYAIDFILVMSEVEYDNLKTLLSACPAIRGVEVNAPSEAARQATSEAGRLVTLEVRANSTRELELTPDYDKTAVLTWGRRMYGESK